MTPTTPNPKHAELLAEEWKDLRGYKGIYKISTYGRIKSVYRRWSILNKTSCRREKYVNVLLHKNKTFISKQMHRLVAETFIKRIPNKNCINHKDGNPGNNHINNLEWVNNRENSFHYFKDNLIGSSFVKKRNRFASQVKINRRCIYLGEYSSAEECHIIYLMALIYFKKDHKYL